MRVASRLCYHWGHYAEVILQISTGTGACNYGTVVQALSTRTGKTGPGRLDLGTDRQHSSSLLKGYLPPSAPPREAGQVAIWGRNREGGPGTLGLGGRRQRISGLMKGPSPPCTPPVGGAVTRRFLGSRACLRMLYYVCQSSSVC